MPLCNKLFPFILSTLCLFHLHNVSGETLTHICPNSGNYTLNDPYDRNLKDLLMYLTAETPTNGFAMASKGELTKNRTHGLAFCRGDLTPQDCWNCVVNSCNELLNLCPNNKGATMLQEFCTVRYSNEDFFGNTSNTSWFCWRSEKNVSGSMIPMHFGKRVTEFLSQVSDEAVFNSKMYASGILEIDESITAYGLAQCSRDLSSIDCKKCLNESLAYVSLPQCGQEREGVRVYSEICRVRYEIYPFLNDHSNFPIPVPLPPSSVLDDAASPNPAPTSSSHGFDFETLIGLSSLLLTYFIVN